MTQPPRATLTHRILLTIAATGLYYAAANYAYVNVTDTLRPEQDPGWIGILMAVAATYLYTLILIWRTR